MKIDIIIILITIFLSAFFSGLEIAFVSANKLHIELEKKRKGYIPKILSRLTKDSSKFITTMLVGNNISLVIYSYFMGKVIVDYYAINSILLQYWLMLGTSYKKFSCWLLVNHLFIFSSSVMFLRNENRSLSQK